VTRRSIHLLLCFCALHGALLSGVGRQTARWGGGTAATVAALVGSLAHLKIQKLKRHPRRAALAAANGELERLHVLRRWALGVFGAGSTAFTGSFWGETKNDRQTEPVVGDASLVVPVSVSPVGAMTPEKPGTPSPPDTVSPPSSASVAVSASSSPIGVDDALPMLVVMPIEAPSSVDGVLNGPVAPLLSSPQAVVLPIAEPQKTFAASPKSKSKLKTPKAKIVEIKKDTTVAPRVTVKPQVVPVVEHPFAPALTALAPRKVVAPVSSLGVKKSGVKKVATKLDKRQKIAVPFVQPEPQVVDGIITLAAPQGVTGNFTDDTRVRTILEQVHIGDAQGLLFLKENEEALPAGAAQIAASATEEIRRLIQALEPHLSEGESLSFDYTLYPTDFSAIFSPVTIPGDGHCAAHCYVFFATHLDAGRRAPRYFMASFDAIVQARKLLYQERLAQLPEQERTSVAAQVMRSEVAMEFGMPQSPLNAALAAGVDSHYYLGEEDIMCMAKMLRKPVVLWVGTAADGYRITKYAVPVAGQQEAIQGLDACCHVLFTQSGDNLAIGGGGHWSVLVPRVRS